MKLCDDCKWMRPHPNDPDPMWSKCHHPASHYQTTSPIDGSTHEGLLNCDHMRMLRCGPDGKLFEPRDGGGMGFV
jgi:hypothetical protein